MMKSLFVLFLTLAPVPKEKPIEPSEFIGKWILNISDQSGAIEFYSDHVYVATLENTFIYSGTWSYKDGYLNGAGKIYLTNGKELCPGGFYVKIDKRFSGEMYDKLKFTLSKP